MAVDRGDRKNLRKLIVVLGPTASGKSEWVNLFASKFNGEVVSADSRQVYKEFTIGTNKESGTWQSMNGSERYIVDGIAYHLIDCIDPHVSFNVYEYQKMAMQAIDEISMRNSQPFLSGGTGMYIDAVVDNWRLSEKSFDKELRKELSNKSNIELLRRLEKIDPETARSIDKHNTARLIRAVEIVELTGRPKGNMPERGPRLYTSLKIGVQRDMKELYERINTRVDAMFSAGLVEEVESLYKKIDKAFPVFFSIGYKELIAYIEGETTLDAAKQLIKQHTRNYAKRQMTWWRRDESIQWCATKDGAERLITNFLKTT